MKKMQTITIFALCLVLATSAMAERSATATRIDDTSFNSAGIERNRQDCTVGNLNTPISILSGWFTGAEGYKYLFNPFAQDCACPLGFQLETVTMMLNFPETATYPIEFGAYVDLEEAVFDPASGCQLPGPEICVGEVFTITIDEPGNYNLTLPVDCACAFMDYFYFVSFHFTDLFEANLIVDDMPVPCTSYNNWGAGWVDLYTQGFDAFGLPIIFGDVACCEFPVGNETRTWGGVKNLFR